MIPIILYYLYIYAFIFLYYVALNNFFYLVFYIYLSENHC